LTFSPVPNPFLLAALLSVSSTVSMEYGAYGATKSGFQDKSSVKLPHMTKSRKKMSPIIIFLCVLCPWLVFTAVSWAFSFRVHYTLPAASWLILLLSVMLSATFGALSYAALMKEKQSPGDHYSSTWYVYLSVLLLTASLVGWFLGDLNYYTNMQQYYDLKALAEYYNIDPATTKGAQMIDASSVVFKEGSGLSLDKAYVFINNFKYCVAPVSVFDKDGKEVETLKSYDFWAIGLDCCDGNKTSPVDFKCGAYTSKKARQGLRLMRDDQRQFFRLAVQQAEAAHGIQAIHPVFFYWTEDAKADLENYQEIGYSYFYLGILLMFIGVVMSAFVSIFVFTKMGY